MDLEILHQKAVETWTSRVEAVTQDQWDQPTPCEGWTVRDLVNHVVSEQRWTAPLMRGRTVEEVGSAFDGDVLGADPAGSARSAATEATSVVREVLPAGGTVHLSSGEEDMEEYVRQLSADHLIHAWDLGAATGAEAALPPELVDEVGPWFSQREARYRSAGIVGTRPPEGGDAETDLLAGFGRSKRKWAAKMRHD